MAGGDDAGDGWMDAVMAGWGVLDRGGRWWVGGIMSAHLES